jgi:hypothetical protein
MNALSHIYLSLIFKKAVEKKLPIKLHTISFIKGNLKPDFSLLLIKVPHYKIPTSDIVKTEMDRLIQHTANKYTTCTKEFTERLGVVTHYLSDFFCYAHSVRFTGSVYDHVVYEKNLSKYRRTMQAKIMESVGNLPYGDGNMDYQSICSLIDRLHTKYNNKKPSYARDLIFTLRAGIPLVIFLATYCLQLDEVQLAA